MTEESERQLWEELTTLLAEAVPEGATDNERERAAMLALMGHETEIHALHETVRRRQVDLPTGLVTELWTLAMTSPHPDPDDPVFMGRRDTRQTPDNIGRRLKSAIKKANLGLEAAGIAPIREDVSPHALRRTYASLRYACGDDPVYVAEQGGWVDPSFPIRVYAKAVRRRGRLHGAHLDAFNAALEWAAMGSGADAEQARASTLEKQDGREAADRAESPTSPL